MSGTDSDGVAGQWDPTAGSSQFNAQAFLIRMMMAKNSTATLVKVTAINIPTEPGITGSVDVQPLVNLLDGAGNATKHGILHGLSYMRLQGGKNAFIMDPAVGDIGLVVFSDRDISAVVVNKAQANPGSRRRFDMADGMYVGGFLCGVPDQYVQFTTTGIKLADKNSNVIETKADGIHFTGKVFMSADLAVVGAITAASATLTGALAAASATLSGALAAASASLTGALAAVSATLSGAFAAASATISGGVSANAITSNGDVTAVGSLLGGDMKVTGHVFYSLHGHPVSVPSTPITVGSGSPT